MQIEILDEPELEFGSGQRNADLRFGISAYGPADLVLDGAPTSIRLGLVGPRDQLDGLRRWIDRCKRPIRAKDAKYPTCSRLSPAAIATPGSTPASPSQTGTAGNCRPGR